MENEACVTLREDLQEQQPPEQELLQVPPALTVVSLTPLPSCCCQHSTLRTDPSVPYLLPCVQFGNWDEQPQEQLVLLTRQVGFSQAQQASDLHKQQKCPSHLHL